MKSHKQRQLEFLKKDPNAYGGELLKTRRGRARPRPLSATQSMHLVLRSSRARGAWSFRQGHNAARVQEITSRFTARYGVRVHSMANVGNHLHFHLQLSRRHDYKPFIRALTAAIAMAITGACRWRPLSGRFWDYRPFTRLVSSFQGFLRLKDYIAINQLEGLGASRRDARIIVAWKRRKIAAAPL